MHERQGTFITKERSAAEKIRDYILAAVSVVSIFLVLDYGQQLKTLETKFDTAMAYDAATQNRLSKIEGQCPTVALDVERIVFEIKADARREMEKRGVKVKQNEGDL